jgi:erythromycin esterase
MSTESSPIRDWIVRSAVALADTHALGELFQEAIVVGLGFPTHGARELTVVAHSVVRFLVETASFRTLAFDESLEAAVATDDYLRTGDGELETAITSLGSHHRTVEKLELFRWIRSRNERHPEDQVQLIGLAPGPPRGPIPGGDWIAQLEPLLAENAIRQVARSDSKVVYWGGYTHTAVGNSRTVSRGRMGQATHRNAGSHLRARFGRRYVSLGFVFHHGSVDVTGDPLVVPFPDPTFVERVLDVAVPSPYLLRLDGAPPPGVRAWLEAPAKLRLVGPWYVPADDPQYHMSGGSLVDWFDAIVYMREVSPARRLGTVELEGR